MNDEIKEILKDLQEDIENNILIEVRGNCFKPLLDYITNLEKENEKWFAVAKDFEMEAHDLWFKNNELEQENERLKKLDENYPIEEELAEAYRREEDYKSKIEKAVEYIEKNSHTNKSLSKLLVDYEIETLLDILNGRSDE